MKITKTWARKMLKAVNALIEIYKRGEESDSDNCPFCKACTAVATKDCLSCPWVVFKGYSCTGYDEHTEEYVYEYFWGETPISDRLPRLYGWRKRLTNIIERKG